MTEKQKKRRRNENSKEEGIKRKSILYRRYGITFQDLLMQGYSWGHMDGRTKVYFALIE